MLLTLTRLISDTTHTEGSLLVAGETFATMELPWRDDLPDVSCVPAGEYELYPYLSPEKGLVYRLHNPALKVIGIGAVPPGNRSAVEIHNGNFPRQSLGCILIGRRPGILLDPKTDTQEPAILESDAALSDLRRLLTAVGSHSLLIRGAT